MENQLASLDNTGQDQSSDYPGCVLGPRLDPKMVLRILYRQYYKPQHHDRLPDCVISILGLGAQAQWPHH